MMKSWLLLIFFSGIICEAYSAIFYQYLTPIPGHEGHCYDKENDTFYKVGEKMKSKPGFCGQKICGEDKGRPLVEIQTCGKIYVSKECDIVYDFNKSYPDCCGKVICAKPLISKKVVL